MSIGYLYVLELSDGVVKVGLAGYPEGRIRKHAGNLRKQGISITRSWVSTEHFGAASNEKRLIAACADLAETCRPGLREWFIGLRYEDAVANAERLVANSRPYGANPDSKRAGRFDNIMDDPVAVARIQEQAAKMLAEVRELLAEQEQARLRKKKKGSAK